MAIKVEWEDVQGLVYRSYSEQTFARYELLEVVIPELAKKWVGSLTDLICTVQQKEPAGVISGQEFYANIAFTQEGFIALNVNGGDLKSFSTEFQEGMAVQNGKLVNRRSGMLGDVNANAPNNWEWGGTSTSIRRVHILLLVFAHSKPEAQLAVDGLVGDSVDQMKQNGIRSIKSIPGEIWKNGKEHFGFRDGISQPIINSELPTRATRKNLSRADKDINSVNPGEFILGYKNQRDLYPVSPIVNKVSGSQNNLPSVKGGLDFGRNGTYLVFRQLEQNVGSFRKFLDKEFKDRKARLGRRSPAEFRGSATEWKDWLAAKMVGRWQDGAPLSRYANSDSTRRVNYDYNEFYFHDDDPDGIRCPIGAHIRRANPRDSLDKNPRIALDLSKQHRILRRGRNYGDPYNLNESEHSANNKTKRGLLFLCLNSDIAGQFERVQHTWINNPQFSKLQDERDPLLAERHAHGCVMTVQAMPANLRLDCDQQFVTVKGGAYFFMPGMRALRWLAET